MHPRLQILLALLTLLGANLAPTLASGATPAPAHRSGSAPTRAELAAALRRAERSPKLWATINICNTARHPGVIGIRGQMPSLGYPVRLEMAIAVEYWSLTAKAFKPVPAAIRTIVLGRNTTGMRQGGWSFRFSAHAGLLRGSVTFAWRRGPSLLGKVTHKTSPGHRDAEQSDPRGYSAATCSIP